MIGNKYLSELIDLSALKIDALNVVKAPTGSGKTYFALTAIPASIGEKALWQVVYLIDTINGKEQILRNYNAHSYCKAWDEIATGEILYWGDGEESVVIMTYGLYLFGIPCPPCAKHRIEALHPLAGGSRDIERHLFFPQNRQCLYCNQFENVRLSQNQSALLDNRIGFRYNDIYYFVHSQRLQRIQRWRLIAAATVGSHSVFGKISCGLRQP